MAQQLAAVDRNLLTHFRHAWPTHANRFPALANTRWTRNARIKGVSFASGIFVSVRVYPQWSLRSIQILMYLPPYNKANMTLLIAGMASILRNHPLYQQFQIKK